MIERVAFNGNASRLGDEALDLVDRRFLRRLRACLMVDFFVDHRPIEIICSKGESNLRRS